VLAKRILTLIKTSVKEFRLNQVKLVQELLEEMLPEVKTDPLVLEETNSLPINQEVEVSKKEIDLLLFKK
jgi:hypothetical protein